MRASSDADLIRTRQAFLSWRASHPGRHRFPDHLWQAAIALLASYSLARVSRELGLNSARLRQRQLSFSTPHSTASHPPFVELPSASAVAPLTPSDPGSAANAVRLLIERADGDRLTLLLPPAESDRLPSLCSLFLGANR